MQENLDQGNKYCKSIERKIWWSLRCIFLIDQGRQVKSIFVMFVFNYYKIVVKQKKKTLKILWKCMNNGLFVEYLPHCTVDISTREAEAELLDLHHWLPPWIFCNRLPPLIPWSIYFFYYSVSAWLNTQVDNTWF